MTTPESVLVEAHRVVRGPRAAEYGHPSIICGRLGRMWGAMLGREDIDPTTVALMLAALKLARAVGPVCSRDTLVDLAGYAEVAAMTQEAADEAGPGRGADVAHEGAAIGQGGVAGCGSGCCTARADTSSDEVTAPHRVPAFDIGDWGP